MSTHDVDIAIIGGGCVGGSIFSELALRGATSVALIDDGRRSGSATASSGGMHRVFHESPAHVALALAHRSRVAHYVERGWLQATGSTNGSLYFFNRERYAGYAESLHRMQTAGYPFEVVEATQGRKCFPQFRWSEADLAIYEPMAGQMSASAFTDDVIALGMRRGLVTHDDAKVTEVERARRGFRLTTRGQRINARAVVFAGGARMLPLLATVAPAVALEARTLSAVITAKTDTMPNYFDRESLEFGGFGLPTHAVVSTPEPQRLRRELLGGVISTVSASDCYSNDRLGVPDVAGVTIAAGWGGTAFKLALGIGHDVSRRLMQQPRSSAHVSA